jgi:ABC-2 type transport system ATP-binding protein
VLISSHLLAELAQLIDDVVIVSDGRMRLAAPLAELYGTGQRLRVRGRDPGRLWQAFEAAGAVVAADDRFLVVDGLPAEEAGEAAFAAGVPVYEMIPDAPNLEQIFLDLAVSR